MIERIFSFLRALVRAFTFFVGIIGYFLSALVIYPYFRISPMRGRAIICHIIKFYAGFACWFMGIEVKIINHPGNSDSENYLIVSNHLSYTDILALCSYYPACFVTSMAMKRTLFLGQICLLAGCVFVDRKNKKNLSQEVLEITDALKEKLDVVIFPEATSTNGEDVIRFRRPLFKAAIDSGVAVRPFTINYKSIDGEEVSLRNRDKVFWYGDMTFADHLWGVFKIRRTIIEITEGEAVSSAKYLDPADLALVCHEVVLSSYNKITS